MLRDNTESFASDLAKILVELGIHDEGMGNGYAFQLLKFERIEPDVFVWLLRGKNNYIVTINDGGSNPPNPSWLADWASGLKPKDLELILPKGVELDDYPGHVDGYDFVLIYRLPINYDHQLQLEVTQKIQP